MGDVTLTNLSKHFDSVVAVDDIDLNVRDGEFLVLVGPSGCGKSTTLRMIAGLEEATDGDISIAQEDVTERHPKDRDVAMVFQNYALYPHMNVYDNIAFGLTLRKMPDDEIDRRVKDAAQLLGIGELLDRKPGELSGGQRQRVAVGRAIVREPEVFLMDEPLSNLDAKLRVEMRAELLKLHNKLKTTMIYVTHDQTEAMTMGDRIVVMLDGLIQQVGKPLEIYQNPANVFVAGFIGSPSMNFLDVVLRKKNGGYFLDAGEFEFQVPEEMVSRYTHLDEYNGKTITLGIRPEDIYDASLGNGKGSEGTRFEAQVQVTEPMGSETHLYLTIGDQTMTASVEATTNAEEGASLPIRFDLSKAHFFDNQTEKRIQ